VSVFHWLFFYAAVVLVLSSVNKAVLPVIMYCSHIIMLSSPSFSFPCPLQACGRHNTMWLDKPCDTDSLVSPGQSQLCCGYPAACIWRLPGSSSHLSHTDLLHRHVFNTNTHTQELAFISGDFLDLSSD